MKKLLISLFISFSLYGCSSLELQSASSSQEEAQRILSLGLSHEENLLEAKKLDGNHLISVVTLQLINARDDQIQAENDKIEAEKFAELVDVSTDGLNFKGPSISESKETFFSSELNQQNYYLNGAKDSKSGVVSHKLILTLDYVSDQKRNYTSANLCDKWARCDGEIREINIVSINVSNCASNICRYQEVVELEVKDEFLKNSVNTGFSMRFYSKDNSNKITISKAYLLGYLKVAQ